MQPMKLFFNNNDYNSFYRSSVGFDRMTDLIDSALKTSQSASTYPPYNIVRLDDNSYQIELAVAGFSEQDLSLETRENTLIITGGKSENSEDKIDSNYLYRGIAERSFEKKFHLADHVSVVNARLNNGLLSVTLQHELPEALKPKAIKIERAERSKKTKKIEH